MPCYSICDNVTGEMLFNVTGNEHTAIINSKDKDNRSYLANPEFLISTTHYVSDKKYLERPDTICKSDRSEVPADGTTPVTLYDMAEDTHIRVDGPISGEMTTSGPDTLTFTKPGRYVITATAPFPAKPVEIVINAA